MRACVSHEHAKFQEEAKACLGIRTGELLSRFPKAVRLSPEEYEGHRKGGLAPTPPPWRGENVFRAQRGLCLAFFFVEDDTVIAVEFAFT